MDERLRVLVGVAAALASPGRPRLRDALGEAASAASAVEVEEVLLQSYLFLGYPAALNALKLWRELTEAAPARTEPVDHEHWRARGEQTCARIYAGQYERLRENIAAMHPDMESWMIEEGYGKVLGRPGLPLSERELCIVAMLAGSDAPAQLYSHLRGALNTGNPPELVEEVLTLATAKLSADAAAMARGTWHDVLARQTAGGGGAARPSVHRIPNNPGNERVR